jgi:hypothetical protein
VNKGPGPVGCGEGLADRVVVDVVKGCDQPCATHGCSTQLEEEIESGVHNPLFAQEGHSDVEGPMSGELCIDGSCRHGAKLPPAMPCSTKGSPGESEGPGRTRAFAARGMQGQALFIVKVR